MKHGCENSLSSTMNLQEALFVAFEIGLPAPFNFEWFIDAAEHGEWSGLWW